MKTRKLRCYLDEMSKSWDQQDAERIGGEVNRLRGKRSGQWLSDQTHEVGYRLSRTMISELERGKRKYVTTAELVVLAAALNVAPVAMLYPPPYDDEIEVTPGAKMTRIAALERFSGIIDPLSEDHDEQFRRNMFPLIRARQIRELQKSRRNIGEQLRILDDDIANESLRNMLNDEHIRISNLIEELRSGYGG